MMRMERCIGDCIYGRGRRAVQIGYREDEGLALVRKRAGAPRLTGFIWQQIDSFEKRWFSGLRILNFQYILKTMVDGSQSEESASDPLAEARESFITHWGVMGSAWGINRTMAQIHALLLATTRALSTDEVMEELQISRGNANTNLRELVGWGLIRTVIRKGERKEFFEAEKDAWKILGMIARERKRREVEPAIEVLDACRAKAAEAHSNEAETFARQMEELGDLMKLGSRVLEKASASEKGRIMGLAKMFFLGKG